MLGILEILFVKFTETKNKGVSTATLYFSLRCGLGYEKDSFPLTSSDDTFGDELLNVIF